MTFIEIYNRIIPLWGDEIDFLDGRIFDPEGRSPGTIPSGDYPFQSDSLSRQWDGIEKAIRHDDTFGDLMVWTIIKQSFNRRITLILTSLASELSFRTLKHCSIILNGSTTASSLPERKLIINF